MDEHELRRMMYTAQLPGMGTVVIRYPRGAAEHNDWRCKLEAIEVGTGRRMHEGHDVAVLTIGPIGNVAAEAVAEVEAEGQLTVAHYDMRYLKPIDGGILVRLGLPDEFVEHGTVSELRRIAGIDKATIIQHIKG